MIQTWPACWKVVVMRALQSNFKDKEDALQYYSALNAGVDYFITRNKKDYSHTEISLPVHSPAEFVSIV